MEINIVDIKPAPSMEPLSCRRGFSEMHAGGGKLPDMLKEKIAAILKHVPDTDIRITLNVNFWPSGNMVARLQAGPVEIVDADENIVAFSGSVSGSRERVLVDEKSLLIRYPWDILAINEEIVSSLQQNRIEGELSNRATVEGHLIIGKGSRVLPGVFIEGNVIIGENCKIGPNCYLRGNSYIMDDCHIGQAVEIKNSILMNGVSAGHLSYIGDSIICPRVNFGAGTVTANFRHDGKNHRSMVDGCLIDTGRRKFGSIIGDDVHTGIHTGVYPGRKIWPGMMTRPGDIIQQDLKT